MPVERCHQCMFAWICQTAASCGAISRSRQRGLSLIAMTRFLCAAGIASGADLSQAVVRQKVNVVTLAPNLAGEAHPAAQGAVIHDENVVRTGTESRAELEFADLTLARLGSNSIFSFDAKARTMNFTQGAVLFSKPTNSGAIQLRSGAISGAITGSTGFISTVSIEGIGKAGHTRSNGKGTTTLVGMLEGKIHGGSRWTDSAGREHTTPFRLGPGEMLVARPDGAPRFAQFDIPRFLKTSPLVKGFKAPLPNAVELDRAVADYESDERRGFIDKTNVMVSSQPRQISFVGYLPLDVVAQLRSQNPGFLDVGSTGLIRGQLIWNTSADLDLHLTLPNGQEVSFRNVSVTFNNGRAIAMLDHDNLGSTIDVQPNIRVENIVVNGIPLSGLYSFIVNNFNASNGGADSFTLRVFYNGHLQVFNGSLANGQTSPPVIVQVPHR
jgi:FecR protein